jgi:divalent metal cation (Fe/Co/Zn/Cd) transporter
MRLGTGIKVEYLSSAWMIVEALGSVGFGLMAGSFALLAFGGDSLVELISGFAVLSHLRKDVTGSEIQTRRTELLTTGLLFALIPVIGLGAVYSYALGVRPESSPLGIVIAIGAVVIMPYLWWEKRKIGEETRNLPLSIDAVESITCLFMAIALLGGLLAEYFFGLWWADYLATAVIVTFVAREAMESYHELKNKE